MQFYATKEFNFNIFFVKGGFCLEEETLLLVSALIKLFNKPSFVKSREIE